MNFLAHMYLSGESDQIKIGNFIGDYVKGKGYEKYKGGIRYGILLHRKIDAFTDSHPIVKRSKECFTEKYHKYAGVITDIVYDHFLTVQWNEFSGSDLKKIINHSYSILLKRYKYLPVRVQQFLPHFVIYNWMGSYHSFEGLERVFDRMAMKTSLPKNSKNSVNELRENYSQIQRDFNNFFPQLIEHVLKDKVVKIPKI